MGNWKTWLLVIAAFLLIRQCGGCGGSDGLDLSKTNKLVLEPYNGCDFSELTLILYADGTFHAEGVWADTGKSFSQDYGSKWEYKSRSFHDTVYEGIDFSIEYGLAKNGYTYTYQSYGISPNLELIYYSATSPENRARPEGKFRKK